MTEVLVPRIGIVENEASFRAHLLDVLGKMPEAPGLWAWSSAEDFQGDPAGTRLDLVLLDVGLPGINGVELAALIHARDPAPRILMLTALHSDDVIFQAIKNGATGYVLKSEIPDLVEAVRAVLAGGAVMSPSIAARVLRELRPATETRAADPTTAPTDTTGLTTRERQVLHEIVNGRTAAEVGRMLGTSEATVRVQIKSVYAKLQVHNRVQLVNKAGKLGLV